MTCIHVYTLHCVDIIQHRHRLLWFSFDLFYNVKLCRRIGNKTAQQSWHEHSRHYPHRVRHIWSCPCSEPHQLPAQLLGCSQDWSSEVLARLFWSVWARDSCCLFDVVLVNEVADVFLLSQRIALVGLWDFIATKCDSFRPRDPFRRSQCEPLLQGS